MLLKYHQVAIYHYSKHCGYCGVKYFTFILFLYASDIFFCLNLCQGMILSNSEKGMEALDYFFMLEDNGRERTSAEL